MPLPNALVAGAPKCGTTSVFRWLSDHPQTYGPPEKELWYLKDMSWRERNRIDYDPFFAEEFAGNPINDRFVEGYAERFDAADPAEHRVIFEATPDYIYHKTALEYVASRPEQPLIIFLLRRPSARLYSYYQFARNNLGTFEENVTFTLFLRVIRERLPNRLGSQIHLLLEQTKYVNYISVWLSRIPRDRIAIYIFEDIVRDPKRVMTNLASRLSIDPEFYDAYEFPAENESYKVRSLLWHRRFLEVRKRLPHGIRSGLLRNLYRRLNTRPRERALGPAEVALLAELDEEFRPYNQQLSELLHLDLSIWNEAVQPVTTSEN